jgi:serine/threonine protein kinase
MKQINRVKKKTKRVKRKSINRKTINRKTISRKTINRKTINRKTINRKTINRKNINRKTTRRNKFIYGGSGISPGLPFNIPKNILEREIKRVLDWRATLRPTQIDWLNYPYSPDHCGGFGCVFLVKKRGGPQKIIKVYKAEQLTETIQSNDEIKILRKLEILDKVGGFSHGRDNILFFTMKYYNLGDLYSYINLYNGKVVPEQIENTNPFSCWTNIRTNQFDQLTPQELLGNQLEVSKLIVSLIDSLIDCHQKNIVHFDLKPENIMINYDSTLGYSLHIVDFGLAVDFDRRARYINYSGTVQYISPKVRFLFIQSGLMRGIDSNYGTLEKQSKMCDIYSLGCVIFNILTTTLAVPWYLDNYDNFYTDMGVLRRDVGQIDAFKTSLTDKFEAGIEGSIWKSPTAESQEKGITEYIKKNMLLSFDDLTDDTYNPETTLNEIKDLFNSYATTGDDIHELVQP